MVLASSSGTDSSESFGFYTASAATSPQSMATENHQISRGWPLGLQILTTRLGAREALHVAPAARNRYSTHLPSNSSSSFSSSDLDTESSASFFQDNSVSLGRLIGFKRRERGRALYLPNSIHHGERNRMATGGPYRDVSRGGGGTNCIPLLLDAVEKISRNKIKSKQSDS